MAFLDVNFHLSSIEDVNNWLGRSLWSADAMANNDYAEVRISSVAITRDQIFANYTLGPNRVASTVTLNLARSSRVASVAALMFFDTMACMSGGRPAHTFALAQL